MARYGVAPVGHQRRLYQSQKVCLIVSDKEMHTIEGSNKEYWTVGYYPPDKQPILKVNSGQRIRYHNMPSMYDDQFRNVRTLEQALEFRPQYPTGPHTIVGPVEIASTVAGDTVEVRILDLVPASPAINLCVPGSHGIGSVPEDYPDGFIRRFDFDPDAKNLPLNSDIEVPMSPFPGIIAVQPAGNEALSTVPPGVFGGNIDLKNLTAGTRLFLPTQHDGARLFFGDFHAAQGDGEVNLTALECGAERFDVELHTHNKDQVSLNTPVAETPTHWIVLGFGASLDEAFIFCLKGVLDFLHRFGRQTKDDAYFLASTAVDFRMTQTVNPVKGVHGMISKELFTPALHEHLTATFGYYDSTHPSP